MAPRRSASGVNKSRVSGGNTTLFKFKDGKYVRRKGVLGAGLFQNIFKHINKHKSKIVKIGSKLGKRVLIEAKTQLRKPENRKLLRNVTDQLIEKVANNIDQVAPVKSRHKSQGARKARASKSLRFRDDMLRLTKREAKKIARTKSRKLVDDFANYVSQR